MWPALWFPIVCPFFHFFLITEPQFYSGLQCPAKINLHLPVFLAARHAHVTQFWSIIWGQSHLVEDWGKLLGRGWLCFCVSFCPFFPSSIFLLKRLVNYNYYWEHGKRIPKTSVVKFLPHYPCLGLLVHERKTTLLNPSLIKFSVTYSWMHFLPIWYLILM